MTFSKQIWLWTVLVIASSGYAQPIPKLTSLSQQFVTRGTSLEATLTGENLEKVTGFLISGEPGVTAALAEAPSPAVHVISSGGGISSVEVKDGKSVKCKLTVAPEASLQAREIRAVTSEGVSNPLSFQISHLPEISEAGQINREADAQSINLPGAINGRISAQAESDFYRFKARRDQSLVFEVIASRTGSTLDSSLAVLNLSGKELARDEDSNGLDSLLHFKAPEDGEYLLQIRDFRYDGSNEARYRILAGAFPYITKVFPLGGRRGQRTELTVKGYNLASSKITLQIAPDAALGRQEIRALTGGGISNPFSFDVADLAQFFEKEPNTAIDQADQVAFPGVLNGRIQSAGDYDAFKFKAEKNQSFTFDVIAQRFGSPLDVLLTLADASGNVLQRSDDSSGADARLERTMAEAGDYILIVEDLLGRGGEDFVYRLATRQGQPSFTVAFLPDNPRIHQGGHLILRCEVNRQGGFNETVRIEVAELPAGLYAAPLLLDPSVGSGLLTVTATKDAPLGVLPLKVKATGAIGGRSVTKNAEPLNGDRPAKAAFLTVLPEAPFTIHPATLMAQVEQEQAANLEFFVQRQPDFKGEVKVTAEGFSTGRDPITRSFDLSPVTLPDKDSKGRLQLRAKVDSEITTRPVVLKAEATVNGQTITQYSTPIPVATASIPFVLSTSLRKLTVAALPSSAASAAAEATFSVKVNRRDGFTNELQLVLEGVPEGVTATVDPLPANAAEANIKLVSSEKAPAGKEFPIKIKGAGIFKDRTYRQQAPEITLVVNAPSELAETAPVAANTTAPPGAK